MRISWTHKHTQIAAAVTIVVVPAALSFAAGLKVGMNIFAARLVKQYDETFKEEMEATRIHYAKLYKRDEFTSPTEVFGRQKLEEIARNNLKATNEELGYNIPDVYVEVPEEVVSTLTLVEDAAWDYEVEIAARDEAVPYIIHKDEFDENEQNYTQISLTYFSGDDVLIDDKDGPIPDSDSVVGDSNLLRFGHGSEDPSILFIRNHVLELDIEVVLDERTAAAVVFGFIQHSDHRKVPKFRGDDE